MTQPRLWPVPPRRVILAALMIVTIVLALGACAPRVRPQTTGTPAVLPAPSVPLARPARLSSGCTASVSAPLPEHLLVDGRPRVLLVTAPRSTATQHDLVIAFHGRTNDAARARAYFGLDEAMPRAVIVYPRGLPAGPGSFAWSDPGDPVDGQRDVALVEAIVAAVGAARCIDLARVFVVGHSLGAHFANDLACHHAHLVRAVASVAGGVRGERCEGRSAALLLHHPDDRLVPIAEGERARDAFLAANGIDGAVVAAPVPLAGLRCERYDDADHPVLWCPLGTTPAASSTDPHGWPQATATGIAAFFRSLP